MRWGNFSCGLRQRVTKGEEEGLREFKQHILSFQLKRIFRRKQQNGNERNYSIWSSNTHRIRHCGRLVSSRNLTALHTFFIFMWSGFRLWSPFHSRHMSVCENLIKINITSYGTNFEEKVMFFIMFSSFFFPSSHSHHNTKIDFRLKTIFAPSSALSQRSERHKPPTQMKRKKY